MAQEPAPHPATDDHAEAVAAQVAAEITHLQAEVAELRRGRTGPARVRELEPVSYTHLDVYKRQCWSR